MKYLPLTVAFFFAAAIHALTAAENFTSKVVPVDATAQGATDDLFQNARPTGSSPVFGAGEEGRDAELREMFGSYVDERPSKGATVFAPSPGDPVFWVEFETAAPVSFKKVRVILEEDFKGTTKGDRSAGSVRLLGRADAGGFGDEQEIFKVDLEEDYEKAYSSYYIEVTVTGLEAKDLQKFRMEFTGHQRAGEGDFGGPRVVEVDALPE